MRTKLSFIILVFTTFALRSAPSVEAACDVSAAVVNDVSMGPGNVPLHAEWPHSMASRTIPLVHINTEDFCPIVDKINYLPATMCVEVPDKQDRWTPLGSFDEPVELEIRGRGNFSWLKTEKKAYKLKFKKKTPVLGMPANKHYALISYDIFYTSTWMAPYVGMEVCRMVQPEWVPRMQPVEVVLNGEYRGIYLLVESIKIASDRLNIEVQNEEETDPEVVANGGWLVELDNQNDEFQIKVPSVNKNNMLRVTHKEPEKLSDQQRLWLTEEFTHLSELIDYPENYPDESWTDHFDLTSIARYMVIREFLHDIDGYSGSQYFYRNIGSDKWVAGPMWDLEIWPAPKPGWIRDFSGWSIMNWIPNMMRSEELNREFYAVWDEFYPTKLNEVFKFIEDAARVYKKADSANTLRWQNEWRPVSQSVVELKGDLAYNAFWIDNNRDWSVSGVEVIRDNNAETGLTVFTVGRQSVTIGVNRTGGKLEVYTVDGVLLREESLVEGVNYIDLTSVNGMLSGPRLFKVVLPGESPVVKLVR